MAKYKRTVVGSVIASKKDDKSFYIKVNGDHVLKSGQYLNLETKAGQLASLESAVAAGKLTGDAEKGARERISKIPDFVKFQVVAVSKE